MIANDPGMPPDIMPPIPVRTPGPMVITAGQSDLSFEVTDDFIDHAYRCIASLGDKGDDYRIKNKLSLRPDLLEKVLRSRMATRVNTKGIDPSSPVWKFCVSNMRMGAALMKLAGDVLSDTNLQYV